MSSVALTGTVFPTMLWSTYACIPLQKLTTQYVVASQHLPFVTSNDSF